MTVRIGRPCRLPISKSTGSWPGRDLDDAGAELGIDRLVRHHPHGDGAADGLDLEVTADVLRVARVVGMHGQAGVAELGLGPHGAERERTVLDVDELRVALLALDFQVGQHRLAARAPVHDAVVAIDQSLVVEPHEDLAHRAGQPLVHREAQARPVARGAQLLELTDDRAAGLLLPLPDARHEGLAPEVLLGLALGGQLALHHDLGGDAGVIGARLPERVEAVHALETDQHVLQREGEGVAHVQRARDVGRRDDDAVGRLVRGGIDLEIPALLPLRIPALLDGGRLVAVGDRRAGGR